MTELELLQYLVAIGMTQLALNVMLVAAVLLKRGRVDK